MPDSDERKPKREHKGWTSRGYLPHYDSPYVIQRVNFRLNDSLPKTRLEQIKQELLHLPEEERDAAEWVRKQAWLDAGHGRCALNTPWAAELVQTALLHFHDERYRLHAWVIMPNHVHVLFEPFEGNLLEDIIHSWKSFTGRRLVPLVPETIIRRGEHRVWQPGYWDRFIRDQVDYDRAVAYIERNPVEAGLVSRPEDWQWSSAARRMS